jgi:hypothetical protein
MRKILLGALIVIVLVLEVVLVNRLFTSRDYLVFDFVLRWHGAQALLFEGKDPYSKEVTNQIQMELVGRPLSPEQCGQGFLYPAFIAFTIPHFLLPVQLALPLWIVTQQVLLVVIIWLVIASTGVQHKIGLRSLVILTLGGVTFFYSLQNLGYAQFSIYVLFWLVLAWWLWEKERYLLAGMALTLVASKPQLAILVLPLWLLLAVVRRRWSFVLGFSVLMLGWVLMPAFVIGNWLSSFLGVVKQAGDTCVVPVYKGSTLALRLGISALLLGATSVAWFKSSWKLVEPRMGFMLSVGVAVTLLITPFIHHYDLVLTLLPLLYGLCLLGEVQSPAATVLRTGYWGTMLIVPWVLQWLAPAYIQESVQLWLVPLVVLVLLVALPFILRRQSTGSGLLA